MLHRFVWVYTCQNATLLEITCRSSNVWGSNPQPKHSTTEPLRSRDPFILRYFLFYTLNIFLFDLTLCIPANNFSVMSGEVSLGWTSTKALLGLMSQGSEAGEARTWSTTEPLRSLHQIYGIQRSKLFANVISLLSFSILFLKLQFLFIPFTFNIMFKNWMKSYIMKSRVKGLSLY